MSQQQQEETAVLSDFFVFICVVLNAAASIIIIKIYDNFLTPLRNSTQQLSTSKPASTPVIAVAESSQETSSVPPPQPPVDVEAQQAARRKSLANVNDDLTIALNAINDDSIHKDAKSVIFAQKTVNDKLAILRSEKAENIDLNFSGKALSLLPINIRRLDTIVRLDLSNNHLRSLPFEFCKNQRNLKELNLSNNLFFELPAVAFPSLEVLKLANNRFEYIPVAVLESYATLRHFEIQNNRLLVLNPEIGKLTQLEYLDISYNELLRLPDEVGTGLMKLKSFKIHHNKFMNRVSTILEALFERNPELEECMLNDEQEADSKQLILQASSSSPAAASRRRASSAYRQYIPGSPPSAGGNHSQVVVVGTPSSPVSANNSLTSVLAVIDTAATATTTSNVSKPNPKRAMAIQELLQSETKYTMYLEVLYKQFYLPMTSNSSGGDSTTSGTTMYMDVKTLDTLVNREERKGFFPPDLPTIYNFNANLLQELKKIIPENGNEVELCAVAVGETFHLWSKFFLLYSNYCAKFSFTTQYCTTMLKNVPQVKEILDATSRAIPEMKGNALDFNSLLIMPVQRVPRYSLLLRTIASMTHKEHADYEALQKAIIKIDEIAAQINQTIAEAANRMRVVEIQDQLNVNDLVVPNRMFVREGLLSTFVSTKNAQVKGDEETSDKLIDRELFLFKDILLLKETGFLAKANLLMSSYIQATSKSIEDYSYFYLKGGKIESLNEFDCQVFGETHVREHGFKLTVYKRVKVEPEASVVGAAATEAAADKEPAEQGAAIEATVGAPQTQESQAENNATTEASGEKSNENGAALQEKRRSMQLINENEVKTVDVPVEVILVAKSSHVKQSWMQDLAKHCL